MTKLVQAKREGGKAAERRIKQVEREDSQKLLGVQTQASTIQPLRMGGENS